jgi:hypothetical protein
MMKSKEYKTITGRRLDMSNLTKPERAFLGDMYKAYEKGPSWSEFGSLWSVAFDRSGLPKESVVYRICQDLEARLGIAQGTVAPPDYRDYLADLIDERYGSRYRFCKETGVDPGHLSRVFASRSELSLQSLQKILQALHAALVIQPQEAITAEASPKRAAEALAAAAR